LKQRRMFYNTKSLHIMLMPAVIFVLLFSYVPIFGIIMAFQEYKPLLGFTGSEFVGFEQFRYIFSLQSFRIAFRNTFIIAFSKIVLNIIVPLTLSLLLNEITRSWFKRTVQTIIFIPFFFSWAILAGMVMEVFSYTGVINKTIEVLGGEAIPFLISNDYFRTILVSSDVWKGMGYNTVLFLSAITNIDPTLYEAAQVDGASKWKQLTKITIPGIFTMIVLLTILGLGNILNAGFEQILIMYNPTVERTVDILDTLVYRLGVAGRQYSAAAAMGLFKSIVSMVFVGGSYWLAYKTTDYRVF
jgi:putative aldouronate transport system permease protein